MRTHLQYSRNSGCILGRGIVRVFSFIVALLACGGAFAQGATGTEYVCFWSGDLRIFAHEDDTEVTLINIRSGNLLPVDHPRIDRTNVAGNPFILAIAGDSFEGIGGLGGPGDELEVRIEATKPVTVWTGSLAKKSRHPDDPPDDTTADAWGSYIPAFGAAARRTGGRSGGSSWASPRRRSGSSLGRTLPIPPPSPWRTS